MTSLSTSVVLVSLKISCMAPGVDLCLQCGAADDVEGAGGLGERGERIEFAVEPQGGEVAERAALGDRVDRGLHALQCLSQEWSVVHERVGGVGLTDGGVARQHHRVDGDVGDLREVEQAEEEVIATDHGPGEHERGGAAGVPLDEP
ncbi:MAG: hypothetical protein QOE63_1245, partial [Acidimicrobiaceae bacterium]